jgi:hypothetical protein
LPGTPTFGCSAYTDDTAPGGHAGSRSVAKRAKGARASDASLRLETNRYLLHELGIRDTEGESEQEVRVSPSWPFRLQAVRGISATGQNVHSGKPRPGVFRFRYAGDAYFVEAGESFSFWSGAGMSITDLKLYMLGAAWLAGRGSVDLDSEQPRASGEPCSPGKPGEAAIPTITERRRTIKEMAAASLGAAEKGRGSGTRIQIFEGLFFPASCRYLALIEFLDEDGHGAQSGTGRGFVIGSGVSPHPVQQAGAAPWRWLLRAIGGMLERGELQGW